MKPDLLPAPRTGSGTENDNADKVTHNPVRDLLWSVFGPSLLQCDWSATPERDLPQLTPDCVSRAGGHDCEFTSMRLGFRFEQLWHHALSACNQPFEANLQINDGTTTLGELDLLLPQDDHTLHLELALKFYLGTADGWVGPNRRDRLDQKLRHTRERQLSLPQRAVAEGIPLPGTTGPVISRALMRGCLFHPLHDSAILPPEVHPQHRRGVWSAISRLPEYLDLTDDSPVWYVLSKPEWMSPAVSSFAISNAEMLDYLQLHFRHLSSSVCIARMNFHPAEGMTPAYWDEHERWMIVADEWVQG